MFYLKKKLKASNIFSVLQGRREGTRWFERPANANTGKKQG